MEILDAGFWKIVEKFRVKDNELGYVFEMWQRGKQRVGEERLEGYVGLSIRNLRIDEYKRKMKWLSRWEELSDEVEDSRDWREIDDIIYFSERIAKFKEVFPLYAVYIDDWMQGKDISVSILRQMTKKFLELPE